MTAPVWITSAGFLGTLTERRTVSIPVIATGTNIIYSIISGQLPSGLYLNTSTGVILGTPVSVSLDVNSKFVVRAQNNAGLADRTFTFTTTGPTEPLWVTPVGSLPVGLNGEYYAINREYVDYSFRAETDILATGKKLKYFIGDNDGNLPPGLTLTQDGKLLGYIKDSLVIDVDASLNGGYDLDPYDRYPYEYGTMDVNVVDTARPQNIKKIYQFYVTVTDGVVSSRRQFNIEVINPDTLRADTSFIQIDSVIFDASAGYLLAPIWQSKYGDKLPAVSNLGSFRAGRQQILTIYDFDPYPEDGPTVFDWSTLAVNPDIKLVTDGRVNPAGLPSKNLKGQNAIYFKNATVFPVKGMQIRLNEYIPNTDSTTYTITGVIKLTETSGIININQPLAQQIPDSRIFYAGTESRHPPGMNLDPMTGNLYGKLAYQPAYSSNYRFTVKSVKIDQSTGKTTLFNATGGNELRIVGKIYKTLTKVRQSATGSTGSSILTLANTDGITPGMTVTGSDGLYGPDSTTNVSSVSSPTQVILTDPNKGQVKSSSVISFTEIDIDPPEGDDGLPYASSYTGRAGDVILLSKTPAVDVDALYPLMDGTSRAYVFTGGATPYWADLGQTVTSSQIYLLSILGEIPSSIKFVTPSSLGSLTPGEISELVVTAVNTNTDYAVQYDLISGQLPDGLSLNTDGTIQGRLEYRGQTYFDFTATNSLVTFDQNSTTIDKKWYFTVRASDVYRLSAVEQEFSITVNQDALTEYTRMYVKPFLTREKRNAYRDFVTDPIIFDSALIYRPDDPEFGIQPAIKMVIESGIEKINIDDYVPAMQQYFSRKRFYFGQVKSILAQDNKGKNIYELIYVDIIDDQMSGGVAAGSFAVDGHPYYPATVAGMQHRLQTIQLTDSIISVNERLQPKYMTTLQADTGVPLGFVKAVPICYTVPGGGTKILSRINNALSTGAFDFKQFDFDTDRVVIETTRDTEQTGWLAYPTSKQ
jgi:hypothetical protein